MRFGASFFCVVLCAFCSEARSSQELLKEATRVLQSLIEKHRLQVCFLATAHHQSSMGFGACVGAYVCAQANVAEARSAQLMALAQDSEKQVCLPRSVDTLDSDR